MRVVGARCSRRLFGRTNLWARRSVVVRDSRATIVITGNFGRRSRLYVARSAFSTNLACLKSRLRAQRQRTRTAVRHRRAERDRRPRILQTSGHQCRSCVTSCHQTNRHILGIDRDNGDRRNRDCSPQSHYESGGYARPKQTLGESEYQHQECTEQGRTPTVRRAPTPRPQPPGPAKSPGWGPCECPQCSS